MKIHISARPKKSQEKKRSQKVLKTTQCVCRYIKNAATMHLGVKTPPPGPFAVINLQLLQEKIYWQAVPAVPAVYGSGINSSLPSLQNNDLIQCW